EDGFYLYKDGELKVRPVRFIINTHIDTQNGKGIEKKLDTVKTTI
ncbi:6564_t:CDS:1, partial [Cetraspora pellucida]